MQQLGIIKAFIDDRRLLDTQPVFIAGDLNVDKYDAGEYVGMLRILAQAVRPGASSDIGRAPWTRRRVRRGSQELIRFARTRSATKHPRTSSFLNVAKLAPVKTAVIRRN
jgi:hypothetical protein